MTTVSVADKPSDLPANVPPELVRPYPLGARKRTYVNPYETIIPEVHQGPEVFYATDVYSGGKPGWIIRRAEDLRTVYLDTDNFSKKGFSGFAASIGEDWDVIPTELDPPRHSAFRATLNPIFAPKRLAAFEDRVRTRAREWVAGFKDGSECDFISAFASPYPVSIFLELMGLPQEGMSQFLAWEQDLLHNPDMTMRAAAVRAVKAYLLEAIEDRRRFPKDDLITNATTALVEGRPFTDIEVLGHCFNLYVGGLDTVASNLGLHFYHLASHLDDQRALRADPSSISSGVEELLRAYAAVTTFRICAKPFELKGVTFMPGDKVAMATPLGGRDPAEYDRPNEVRLDREPTHLVFGYGAHRCLGSHLARRELNIAMEEVLSSLPEFRLAPGAEIPFFTGGVIHIEELPLVWGRA